MPAVFVAAIALWLVEGSVLPCVVLRIHVSRVVWWLRVHSDVAVCSARPAGVVECVMVCAVACL